MRFIFVLLFVLFVAPKVLSQPETFGFESFIPNNSEVVLKVSGDLNKDAFADLAVVIEETDSGKIKPNTGFGPDTLNLNPRTLLVLFGNNKGKYWLAAKNDLGFIPAENVEDLPCLADPLLTDGGITIKNNVLNIELNYWTSCGSWSEGRMKYAFRYQNEAFELIGFDKSSMNRASGATSVTSINFSTKKKQVTTGGNAFEATQNHPKTKTVQIKFGVLMKLNDCNPDMLELLDDL